MKKARRKKLIRLNYRMWVEINFSIVMDDDGKVTRKITRCEASDRVIELKVELNDFVGKKIVGRDAFDAFKEEILNRLREANDLNPVRMPVPAPKCRCCGK